MKNNNNRGKRFFIDVFTFSVTGSYISFSYLLTDNPNITSIRDPIAPITSLTSLVMEEHVVSFFENHADSYFTSAAKHPSFCVTFRRIPQPSQNWRCLSSTNDHRCVVDCLLFSFLFSVKFFIYSSYNVFLLC